jgi:hypothetical protein
LKDPESEACRSQALLLGEKVVLVSSGKMLALGSFLRWKMPENGGRHSRTGQVRAVMACALNTLANNLEGKYHE